MLLFTLMWLVMLNQAVAQDFKVFTDVPVNISKLMDNNPEDVSVTSEATCSLIAVKQADPELYCYKDGRCFTAQANETFIGGQQTDAWSCKTSGQTSCPLEDGSSVPVSDVSGDSFCNGICTLAGFTGTLPVAQAPPLPCCSSPFTSTSAGCLLHSSTWMSWCEARNFCLDLGADLFSASTEQELADSRAFVLSKYSEFRYWTFARRDSGSWQWLGAGGGRLVDAGEWSGAVSPTATDTNCARFEYTTENDGLVVYSCENIGPFMCHFEAPAC